jgi:hypothetical protein
MDISAPSSGTYSGIVMYDANTTTDTFNFAGGTTNNFQGAIYAPNSNLVFNNNTDITINSKVTASTISVTGSGKVTDSYVSAGGNGTPAPGSVLLRQ